MKRKNTLAAIVLMMTMAAACTPAQEPETAAQLPAESVEAETAINTLTEAEKAEGWTLLFDGESIDQWRTFGGDSVPPGWEAQDGLLVFNAEHGGEGFGDLTTIEQFDNFELSLEWKIKACGNSGVLFRVSEDSDQEFHTGPELQIVDATEGCWTDYRAPDGERAPNSDVKPTQLSGANYDLHPPTKDMVKPVGEWNHMLLIVNGPHVEHWFNEEKVVEYELWSDEWNEMVASSKFIEFPKYGLNKTGHIVLQDHGKTVWFRNLKIRKL
ncbi:MAG: DUF1080 domain-containing protein [Acidobacteriota bacterium]|nr:MAG: DUF1080 domain-containing protein [Acidobacteriota bacterium]